MAREELDYQSAKTTLRRAEPTSGKGGQIRGTAEGDFSDLDERARALEGEEEEGQEFLRTPRRPPVRRGAIPASAARKVRRLLLAFLGVAALGYAASFTYFYGAHSWRFRIESSDNIELEGLHNVSRSQVMDIMGSDIGRNVFFVPLAERKRQLEEIPWVESATVMRLLPNRLRVVIGERTPVAFIRIGSKISLMDASGVLMDLPAHSGAYSFPVITGSGEDEPLSTRSARMKIYTRLIEDLNSSGADYSARLSEVNLGDPEDVKVLVGDPAGAVLVHLGNSHFLERFQLYLAHLAEWRQQFPNLHSVDLRYDRQIIVNPDAGAGSPSAKSGSREAGRSAPKPTTAGQRPTTN